jgi:hypothetical protein
MKVEGPGKSSGVKGPGKTGGKSAASGTGAFSGLLETDTVAGESAIAATAPATPLDALLALQGLDGANGEANARRAKQRGIDLLDTLEQIRIDLLMGGVPQARLDRLQQMVTSQREKVMDPQLQAVLDEIDLRVQVELAKFSMK